METKAPTICYYRAKVQVEQCLTVIENSRTNIGVEIIAFSILGFPCDNLTYIRGGYIRVFLVFLSPRP